MTNDEQQQTYAMLARNYLKAAEAARRPSFDDFHRAHQAEWAARQALTGDQTALAEVIVGMAEEVALLQEAHAALVRQQQTWEDLWRDAQAADDVLEYAQKYMRTEGEKADWSEVMGNLKQARQCLAVPSRRQALKGEPQ